MIWILIEVIAIGVIIAWEVIRKLKNNLKGKKVFFTGPIMSGKTTMIKALMKDDGNPDSPIDIDKDDLGPYKPDDIPKIYTYKNSKYDFQITDMGGADSFLANGQFESLIKANDIIIFVFNCAAYLNGREYEDKVNTRLDFIWSKLSILEGKVLFFVGSHADELSIGKEDAKKLIIECGNEKNYKRLLTKYPLVLGNLTDMEELKVVFNELNKEIDKNN